MYSAYITGANKFKWLADINCCVVKIKEKGQTEKGEPANILRTMHQWTKKKEDTKALRKNNFKLKQWVKTYK